MPRMICNRGRMQCEPGGEDEGWGGAYAARILQRAKPADMPIERPSRVELVINRASRES